MEALVAPETDDSSSGEDDKDAQASGEGGAATEPPEEPLFPGHPEPRAPAIGKKPGAATKTAGKKTAATASVPTVSATGNRGFLMTLQQTDVGKGQTTIGASPRSPEIFIPLRARDADPDFWGWPLKFIESPTKYDRARVPMRLGTEDIVVNIMGWKLKRDLHLRHEALRSGGNIGDILRIEEAPAGASFEPSGHSSFGTSAKAPRQ